MGATWTIALRLGVADLVRSRRSAVKLSWRRTVSKDFLDPSECYIPLVSSLERWTYKYDLNREVSIIMTTSTGLDIVRIS